MPKTKFKITDITDAAEYSEIVLYFAKLGADDVKLYAMEECRIIITHEKGRWHMSISTGYRLPTWWEIKFARYELLPKDITMVMVLPPPDSYVNIHPYTFQLIETPDVEVGQL
jgi:hypothetical protein